MGEQFAPPGDAFEELGRKELEHLEPLFRVQMVRISVKFL